MDLTAYLSRVGLSSETAQGKPDLELLRTLVSHHLRSIPFENLDVLLGRPIQLDIESIFAKLVNRRRGGYCFEQNGLFEQVLEQLGYQVTPLAARVRRDSPVLRPYTHKLLRVGWPGELRTFLVDVGFGAEGPLQPLPFTAEGFACDGRSLHYCANQEVWVVHLRSATTDLDLYAFELQPHEPVDFEMYNHFTSTYPRSNFVNNVMITLHTTQGFKRLVNRAFTEVGPDGARELRISSREHLGQVLLAEFGLADIDVGQLRLALLDE